MRLAHLTDVHVGDPGCYEGGEEGPFGARLRKHPLANYDAVLADIARARPDHLVLSGDLTQSSTRSEFAVARARLDQHLGGLPTTVIPGNHDVFRPEAVAQRWFQASFGEHARCALGGEGFPFCHLPGQEIALLALDSSPHDPTQDPADVKGLVGAEQLARFVALASHPEVRRRLVVVVLHHHLRLSEADAIASDPKDPTPLVDADAVEAAIAAAGARVVLHGHRHKQMRLDLHLGAHAVPVLCPGSGTRADPRADRTARWSMYELDGAGLQAVRTRALDPATGRFVDA